MWLSFDICFRFLCFRNIYGTIYGNLFMKYNKMEIKTKFMQNENEKKGNLPKVKMESRKMCPSQYFGFGYGLSTIVG